MDIALATIGVVLLGYVVTELIVALGRRLTSQTIFVSAIFGFVLGLVLNPITGAFFAPTIGGLVMAAIFGSFGGVLFFVAHDMGAKWG